MSIVLVDVLLPIGLFFISVIVVLVHAVFLTLWFWSVILKSQAEAGEVRSQAYKCSCMRHHRMAQ